MSDLNSLCTDDYSNLVLKLEKTGDIATDTDMENWLDFECEQNGSEWIFPKTKDVVKFVNVAKETKEFFEKQKLELDVCEKLKNIINSASNKDRYAEAVEKASPVKSRCIICSEQWAAHDSNQLVSCQEKYQPKISPNFKRTLMPYQKLPVDHLLAIGNGANFSVPGSGKTTITYAALSNWLDDGTIDKILVILKHLSLKYT